MTLAARIPGLVVVVVALLGLRWMSDVPVSTSAGDEAVLRVAFRLRPERVEVCRDRTPDELAGVPMHMRQLQLCVGQSATYRLEVRRDDAVLVDEVVHGGGLRRDRPIYVSREWLVPPGVADVEVRLSREEPQAREDTLHREQATRGVEPLAFEEHLVFAPRKVVLVTYDEERRVLDVKGAARPAP